MGNRKHYVMQTTSPNRYVVTARNPQDSLSLPESGGIRVLTPLDRGVLVEADLDKLDELPSGDWRVKALPDPYVINIFSYRIDTQTEALPEAPEALSEALKDVETEDENSLNHIVQFVGPVQESWLTIVSERGIRLVEPMGPFAYFVRGEGDAVGQLRNLPFVGWTGELKPAYKVNPLLLTENDPSETDAQNGLGAIEAVNIGVLADGDISGITEMLRKQGSEITAVDPPTTDSYRSIVAEVPSTELLAKLAVREDVRWIDIVRAPVFEDERSSQIAYEDLDGTAAPNTGVNNGYAANLTGLGINGNGVTVAVCDTGIDTNTAATVHADLNGRLAFAVTGSGSALGGTDTDGHGTHVAGIVAGNGATGNTDPGGFVLGQGTAPAARVGSLLANGSRQQRIQTASQQGAEVMNNSYALDGSTYGAGDRTFDLGVRDADSGTTDVDPLVVVFSAGNSGPGGTSCTKAMKNALVIGNSLNFRPGEGDIDDIRGLRASSSRGPSADGRLMPHFVAPGTNIVSARSGSSSRPTYVDTGGTAHSTHTQMSGTSMAAPVVAGMCALLIDWWRQTRNGATPSPALLKAFLAVSTETMVGGPDRNGGTIANEPNNDTGWGRVSLENSLLQTPVSDRGPKIFQDQRHAFTATGQEYRIRVAASDPTLPLRIALAWTDAAGAVGASPALVNDLDLEVLEEGTATLYRGNVFNNGFSTPGGAADALNNLECVFIQNPSGTYEVTVVAGNIAASARPDIATPWQDFGLVIDNGVVPEADPVSVVAVLDRSGSMQSYGYVDVTRQSSRQFINNLSLDDAVGVVSFGSGAAEEFPGTGSPAAITDLTVRTAAADSVNGIGFGGCTFMGAGIQTAGAMLSSTTSRRAMVLLSDGYDNKGCDAGNPLKPSAEDAAAALPADLPIYSCAMGPSSDESLLSQLAQDTDGRYYFMPTIDDLFEIYNYVRGQVTGEGIIVNESSMASRSTVSSLVDACADSVQFTVAWHDESLIYVSHEPRKPNEIAVRLRSPNGRWLPRAATEVTRTVGTGYVGLRIQDPQPGMWTVEVATARERHTPYTVGGFVRSDLDLQFDAPFRARPGGAINLRIGVRDGKELVKGIKVDTTVRSPRYSTDQLLEKYADQLSRIKLPDFLRAEADPDRRQLALARLVLLRNQLVAKGGDDPFAPRSGKLRMGTYSSKPTYGLRKPASNWLISDRQYAAASSATTVSVAAARSVANIGLRGRIFDPRKVQRPASTGLTTGQFRETKLPGSYSFLVRATGYSARCGTRFVRMGMRSVAVLDRKG
jgi:hypothetical protein